MRTRLRLGCRLIRHSLALSVCGLLAAPLSAHDAVDDQIAALTARIASPSPPADLLVRRAELYRQSRHWAEALADLDRAAAIDPAFATLDLERAHILLGSGRAIDAIEPASRFLQRHPNHAGALVIRARAHARLEHHREADADFARALTLRPDPELFIERARELTATGPANIEGALQALDEGISRLGPIVTLEIEAIDLNVRLKRYDSALARIDRVAAQTPRKEEWLARRGAVLEQAGRPLDARDAYQAALVAMSALPSWTQATPASQSLRTRLHTDLARVLKRIAPSTGHHQ